MAVIIEAGREYKDGHGNKRGPMKPEREWFVDDRGYGYYRDGQRMAIGYSLHPDHIVSEWNESPIRTVTRRIIQDGNSGSISWHSHSKGMIYVAVRTAGAVPQYVLVDKAELTNIGLIISQLAEFLDEDKGG